MRGKSIFILERENRMALRRFVIEVGMGVDQHGQDNTRAAEKAVQDAIHRSCLCGLREVAGLKNSSDLVVEVLIGCPSPETVDQERVLKVLLGLTLFPVVEELEGTI